MKEIIEAINSHKVSIPDHSKSLLDEIKKYMWNRNSKVTFYESDDNIIRNMVTVRFETFFYGTDSGSARPDKKNSIQEDTTQDTKTMRELPAKDIRTEGEREGKNKSNYDGFES